MLACGKIISLQLHTMQHNKIVRRKRQKKKHE